MFQYLGYLLFIISVALAAGAIVLATRLRNKYHNNVFSILLYYQVFIYAFGFYGIWGQAALKVLLSDFISPDQLIRISYIAILLGFPFLIFGWLMLIQLSVVISGRKNSSYFTAGFLPVNFSVLVIVGYFLSGANDIQPVFLLKSYYIATNFLISTAASILIIMPVKKDSVVSKTDRKIIASSLFLVMVFQSIPLFLYKDELWIAAIFILAFFAGNAFLSVYLNYGASLLNLSGETQKDISFEDFCKKFEVSPRETDIIREICNGLSNKEISEKLFISLQTVKDHTHRIYIKTNVRSRAQLITLVQEMRLL
jgi:DNA-binding CsgD family transcriptional regulator